MKKTAKSSVMVYRLERLLAMLYSNEPSCFFLRSKAFFASYQQQQSELQQAEQRWQQLQQSNHASHNERQQARQHYSELLSGRKSPLNPLGRFAIARRAVVTAL